MSISDKQGHDLTTNDCFNHKTTDSIQVQDQREKRSEVSLKKLLHFSSGFKCKFPS